MRKDFQTLFYKMKNSIASCYQGTALMVQCGAGIATYFIVISGFDWWYFTHTSRFSLSVICFLPSIIGYFFPVLIPLCMFIYAKIKKNRRFENTAYAILQSAGIGLGISSFYKVLTGRVAHPITNNIQNLVDTSREFRFGLYRGGAFFGWPSSHTTVAFAMSFALITLYPGSKTKHRLLRFGAILYAFYIGIGVSMNIHWFSDFVAGALLGTVIGLSVGKNFLERI